MKKRKANNKNSIQRTKKKKAQDSWIFKGVVAILLLFALTFFLASYIEYSETPIDENMLATYGPLAEASGAATGAAAPVQCSRSSLPQGKICGTKTKTGWGLMQTCGTCLNCVKNEQTQIATCEYITGQDPKKCDNNCPDPLASLFPGMIRSCTGKKLVDIPPKNPIFGVPGCVTYCQTNQGCRACETCVTSGDEGYNPPINKCVKIKNQDDTAKHGNSKYPGCSGPYQGGQKKYIGTYSCDNKGECVRIR